MVIGCYTTTCGSPSRMPWVVPSYPPQVIHLQETEQQHRAKINRCTNQVTGISLLNQGFIQGGPGVFDPLRICWGDIPPTNLHWYTNIMYWSCEHTCKKSLRSHQNARNWFLKFKIPPPLLKNPGWNTENGWWNPNLIDARWAYFHWTCASVWELGEWPIEVRTSVWELGEWPIEVRTSHCPGMNNDWSPPLYGRCYKL